MDNTMRLFAILPMIGGAPDLDPETYPFHGYVLCDAVEGWGAYQLSGTVEEMEAIAAADGVYAICYCSTDENGEHPELAEAIAVPTRAKLNRFLAPLGWPIIPAGTVNAAAIDQIYKRFNPNFTLSDFYICEPE